MKMRNTRILFTCFLFISIFTCSCSSKPPLHESLNGSWKNDMMTVTFDFNKGVYTGVVLGQPFSHKLALISEQANVVVFKSDESQIVCQFQSNGSIMLTKEGGIPLVFTRVE